MKFARQKRRNSIFSTLRLLSRSRQTLDVVHFQGNRVSLLLHGGDFFAALFAAMNAATTAICAEFYIIRPDATGKIFAQALIEAAARGVDVSLIYDSIGCHNTPSSYFQGLEAAGVRCLSFNKPSFTKLHWLDIRDHRKLVVIDGKTAFLGGLNVGDEYAGYGESFERWRDVGIRLDGPAVSEVERLFRLTWDQQKRTGMPGRAAQQAAPDPAGGADVMIVNGTPHHTRSVIRSSFRLAMAGAVHQIRIITPYFVPGPRVVRSLLRAVKSGVKVQMIVPSISDLPLILLMSRAYLAPLLKAGVEIFERQETILHAKVMLIDDYWVTLGSANFDFRSFHRNYEINVIIDSREFGSQVKSLFDAELEKSRQVALSEYVQRSRFARFLEWLLRPLSRFL
jgi:cardiolipin synthase